jgi:lipopolysaccharide/colanic/teichoic acid biosynthesis glycosyltransferase
MLLEVAVNGWVVGFVVGAVVVAVVVAVLLLMISGARRTAEKAEAIVEALHATRDGTANLWKVRTTVSTTHRIVSAAASARSALTPGGAP